ncbi:MAG: phage resistance protein, partial [Deltaproteobacteria bacterium]
MSGQALLRDLVEIPEEVHAGDYVLKLTSGIGERSTITDYVVTPQLAGDFDRALGLIKVGIEKNASQAAYLDGSFGSGKSHFMAVLHAILSGDPDAREKKGLADVVHKHDSWLAGRKFLMVPYHIVGGQTLDAVILGGYVAHVAKAAPQAPLPAVFRGDQLLADAADLRQRLGDAEFIAQLPVDPSWPVHWTSELLDQAFREHGFSKADEQANRLNLVSALVSGPFRRYARAVSGDKDSYIPLDEGLSVISRHAREVLGYDAVVLMLDELVLWLANSVSDSRWISQEAAKVSKLVESAERERPAPIISFVPRQRDLRDLVGKDSYGNELTSLFDTLKYWDGRFDSIRLDDKNLPAIVHERLLRPRDDAARAALDAAFARSTSVPQATWDVLLDTHGEQGDRESFRLTYPFSPAFTHAMVDISGALQRQRTALKLMQQLLINYRDTLPVGQLMPLGAIFEVLAGGSDMPFSEKLIEEFNQAKRFYTYSLRPWLLTRFGLSEEQAATVAPTHAFRGADLVVKTLLLSALVPNVPALKGLTATRLAALNHGSIVTMLPNQERRLVTQILNELSAQFGEIRVSGNPDDPRVELALIGVDTGAIIRAARFADEPAARRTLVRELLWKELRLSGEGTFEQCAEVAWRGTARRVDVLLENVRDRERMPSLRFQPDPDTIRLVIDYPWDEANFSPADDLNRIHNELQPQLGNVPTIFWLPHFLSDERKEDLATLIAINYALERDRLTELTPHLTADDRLRARTLLEGRRSALTAQLTNALRQAYGVHAPDDINLGQARVAQHVETLVQGLE